MKTDRLRHLIVFTVLIVLGQWCANSWSVRWREVLVTDNGRIFTASSFLPFWRTEIWEWDSTLSSHKQIASFADRYGNLHANRDGSILVCDRGSKIVALDTENGTELWISESADFEKLHVLGDNQHLLVVHLNTPAVFEFTILNLQSGEVADRYLLEPTAQTIQQVHLHSDGVTLEKSQGQLLTYVWNGQTIAKAEVDLTFDELDTAQRWYEASSQGFGILLEPATQAPLPSNGTVSLAERRELHPSKIQIVDGDGKSIATHKIGMSVAMSSLLGGLFVIAGVIWVVMLMHDAGKCQCNKRRSGLIDLAWIAACLILVTTPGLGAFVPEQATGQQAWRMAAIPLAVVFWFLFGLLSAIKNPVYRWAAILGSCTVAGLVPTTLLALATPLANLNSPIFEHSAHAQVAGDRKLRFNIHHLILTTAAIAIFIGIGVLAIETLPAGIAYALVIVAAIGASLHTLFAKTAVVLTSTGLFASAILNPQFGIGMGVVNHLLMLLFVFSFLSFYAYQWGTKTNV